MSSSGRRNPFWKRPSTLVITVIRLALILLPQFISLESSIPNAWLFSSSLTFVLVKPQYTLSHVQEALAIQQLASGRFADAYEAHPKIQLPPLLLAALAPLAKSEHASLYIALVCLLVDFLLACMLEFIGHTSLFTNQIEHVEQEAKEQDQLPEPIRAPNAHIFSVTEHLSSDKGGSLVLMESLPSLAAQIYFYSPAIVVPGTLYSCFQSLPGFFLVASLYEGVRRGGSPMLSTFLLATAAYLEPHHFVFLIPLTGLSVGNKSRTTVMILSFGAWLSCLHGLSYQLVGHTFSKVIQSTYGLGWRMMSPSMSVQWYFAMQLFSRFRNYFGALILGLPYITVVPLTARLYKYPMVLVAIFSMLWTIFRPVETLFDVNLSLCFFLFSPRSLARMETVAFLSLCSMGVPVLLNVVDHWMWLNLNTGNANYMFFQCLAFNVFLGIILAQFCSASLQRDKALRLAEKERTTTAD